jgi:hypothetical protein
MRYKDLEKHVEARIQVEQNLVDRLASTGKEMVTELQQSFEFPNPANGAVELEGTTVTIVVNFQRRSEQENKKAPHSLKCEVQLVNEGGSIVAYLDRGSEVFTDVEHREGRQKVYAAVDRALEARVDEEHWLEPPAAERRVTKGAERVD